MAKKPNEIIIESGQGVIRCDECRVPIWRDGEWLPVHPWAKEWLVAGNDCGMSHWFCQKCLDKLEHNYGQGINTWNCIFCGAEVTSAARPEICPECEWKDSFERGTPESAGGSK